MQLIPGDVNQTALLTIRKVDFNLQDVTYTIEVEIRLGKYSR